MVRYVFVYGSLLVGEHNQPRLAPFVRFVRPASVPGMELAWACEAYPGMVPGPGTVAGELVELDPDRLEEAMAALDELEEYFGPGNPANEYDRITVRVFAEGGEEAEAWAYLWNGDAALARRVSGGDWRAARRYGK